MNSILSHIWIWHLFFKPYNNKLNLSKNTALFVSILGKKSSSKCLTFVAKTSQLKMSSRLLAWTEIARDGFAESQY